MLGMWISLFSLFNDLVIAHCKGCDRYHAPDHPDLAIEPDRDGWLRNTST